MTTEECIDLVSPENRCGGDARHDFDRPPNITRLHETHRARRSALPSLDAAAATSLFDADTPPSLNLRIIRDHSNAEKMAEAPPSHPFFLLSLNLDNTSKNRLQPQRITRDRSMAEKMAVSGGIQRYSDGYPGF